MTTGCRALAGVPSASTVSIPPRAFQAFQARGILPIAPSTAREHLVHARSPTSSTRPQDAPVLRDPIFAAYLRRIGELGPRAFSLPEEHRLDDAIHALSEEGGSSDHDDDVARAEAELGALVGGLRESSEAARLSRLYWGRRIRSGGRVDDYKISVAGAGIARGEHSCHDTASSSGRSVRMHGCHVRHHPTQPQLFVTPPSSRCTKRSTRRRAELAANIVGQVAIERAVRSRETASVQFSSGAWVIGVLAELGGGSPTEGQSSEAPAWLAFEGSVVFAWDGSIFSADLPALQQLIPPDGYLLPTGRLADGSALAAASDQIIDRATDPRKVWRGSDSRPASACRDGWSARPSRRRTLVALGLSDVRLELPDGRPGSSIVLCWRRAIPSGARRAPWTRSITRHRFSKIGVPMPAAFPRTARPAGALSAPSAPTGRSAAMAGEFPAVHAALLRDHTGVAAALEPLERPARAGGRMDRWTPPEAELDVSRWTSTTRNRSPRTDYLSAWPAWHQRRRFVDRDGWVYPGKKAAF